MEIYDVAIAPLILGIVELMKKLGLPGKFSGLVATILGIVIGILYLYPENVLQGILVGMSMGLTASGLYSTTKNTVEGIKN